MQSVANSSVLPTPFRHVSQKTHSVTDNVRSASSTARSDEHALRPVIIGLIGGVASGKSTAASHLSSLGALWLDSDKAAREVLHWPEVIQQLRSQFGDEVIDSQGLPDRKAIAARVFGDDEPQIRQRRWLEQLIHPRVRQLTSSASLTRATRIRHLDRRTAIARSRLGTTLRSNLDDRYPRVQSHATRHGTRLECRRVSQTRAKSALNRSKAKLGLGYHSQRWDSPTVVRAFE